ncbi:MAG: uracil-DNA glycosylase [Gammaproteobacteria bacterium]|nr:uracil-DNA glycosylase [Gammaproteobacteria bacterium]
MNNSLRDEYLEAMGIQQWVARDSVDADQSDAAGLVPASVDSGDGLPGWQELEARVAACTKCALHESRTQTVFGVGSKSADWLIIGEAPGADEDQQGEPFVGRAGQLLNEMLFAAGFQRSEVYIANILKCRPPANRDPSADEVACCQGYLDQQIGLLNPKLILAVGGVAAHNLLQTDTPVGRLRGVVHTYGERKTPVIVTYHPAYLLRSPREKRKVWCDLQFAQGIHKQQQAGKVPDVTI